MKNPGLVIGNGDIAKAIVPKPGFLYFASGVSNSQETRESEYEREKRLLLSQEHDYRLVYFSSLSVFYGSGRYQHHKRHMEDVVRTFPNWNIVRLGNITWGTNPHTIINHLRNTERVEIRDETRYIIDRKEFDHWMNLIPDWNCEMNITGQPMKIIDIFNKYCL